jgi:hypothetical protein
MTKFEYKFELNIGESFTAEEEEDRVEAELDELGSEGWELVAVSPCGKDNSCLGYWFKRPIEAR